MNKLTFIGNIKEGQSKTSIIKEIYSISCRMQLDFVKGFLTVENVDDTQLDTVIDLINNYYDTDEVIIDNLDDATSNEETISVPIQEETQIVPATEQKKSSKISEPQSPDDLIIKNVEFENKHIEELINKFFKTAYWAIYKQGISEQEIGNYILSMICEISMAYAPNVDLPELVVGDVVEVNYGMHLKGEIRGKHISAIVCDITPYNMVYLVPITKQTENLTSTKSPLPIVSTDMTFYFDEFAFASGTALVDKSKYLRIERVSKVVGKTSPAFLIKLLQQLPKTFDFTSIFPANESEETTDAIVQTPISNNKSAKTSAVGKEESALLELFGEAFSKLSSDKSVEEQLDVFFADIDMPSNLKLMKEAFLVSSKIDNINFDDIIAELKKSNPNIKEAIIKSSLKTDFKNWLEKYPKLIDVSSRFSLTSLIKTFVKHIK